jgi:Na+-translocating ferredoxin:NAD+ oxidoreductase RnfD subunit
VIPFTSVLLFTGFAATGLLFRHQPGRHKRLMALATMAMLPPALGRAFFWLFGSTNPLWFFGATVLVIVALAIHDRRTLGHTHPVTLWGGLLLAASFPGRLALGYTDAWSRFAHWLTG